MSTPQSNSTHTNEKPCEDVERTRRTLVAPFTAVSMGNVTRRSTSSGAMPVASVSTTTVGDVRSGKTSTSIFCTAYIPPMVTRSTASIIANLLLSENFIIELSMIRPSCD